MKNVLIIFSLVTISVISTAFVINNSKSEKMAADELYKVEIPADVNKVLENSCIGCHNTDSKNTKGKNKLNFDELTEDGLSKGKLLGKLGGIKESVSEGEMPPEKFLKKYPDRALSNADSELIINWVNAEAKKIMQK